MCESTLTLIIIIITRPPETIDPPARGTRSRRIFQLKNTLGTAEGFAFRIYFAAGRNFTLPRYAPSKATGSDGSDVGKRTGRRRRRRRVGGVRQKVSVTEIRFSSNNKCSPPPRVCVRAPAKIIICCLGWLYERARLVTRVAAHTRTQPHDYCCRLLPSSLW